MCVCVFRNQALLNIKIYRSGHSLFSLSFFLFSCSFSMYIRRLVETIAKNIQAACDSNKNKSQAHPIQSNNTHIKWLLQLNICSFIYLQFRFPLSSESAFETCLRSWNIQFQFSFLFFVFNRRFCFFSQYKLISINFSLFMVCNL